MSNLQKYRIQDIVFPTESKHLMCRELFYRGKLGGVNRIEHILTLGTGQVCDFLTYINSCSWAKWRKFTKVKNVSLVLDIEGSYEIRLVGYYMDYGELVRDEFEVITQKDEKRGNLSLAFPDNNDTIIGFEIAAIDKCVIYGGYYEAEYEGELNDVHLSIATTTCWKEEYIKKNVQLIKSSLLSGDDEIKDHLTVHVVDNGRTLKDEEIVGDNVFLHPNRNTGGSGGFARGMMESLHQNPKATHVLLMDDDVLVLPESIKRTYHVLRLVKDEYKECFVNGAMLRYEKPNVQHEDLGYISEAGAYMPYKPYFNQAKLEAVVMNDGGYYQAKNKYAAWWYCCIPRTVIEKNGLPFPMFIRGDDSEYSLRSHADFISMNGICVWHLGFDAKYNASMNLYQAFRNLHIAKAGSDILNDCRVHDHYKLLVKNCFLKFEYNGAELLLRAMEDFLKGPKYIAGLDGEKVVKENAKLNEKLESLSAYPDINIHRIEDCYADAPRNTFDKLFYHFTLNGNKFCPEFLLKKGPLHMAAFDFSMQVQNISRVKEYAAVNPYNETVVIRKLDKKRYKELKKRYDRLEKYYEKNYDKVQEMYRKSFKYYTSEEFWREYLGLDKGNDN